MPRRTRIQNKSMNVKKFLIKNPLKLGERPKFSLCWIFDLFNESWPFQLIKAKDWYMSTVKLCKFNSSDLRHILKQCDLRHSAQNALQWEWGNFPFVN